jgi:hypothetical protein
MVFYSDSSDFVRLPDPITGVPKYVSKIVFFEELKYVANLESLIKYNIFCLLLS